MSISLSSSIAVPIANKPLRLAFTASVGNFVRVWCTAAPAGSKLRTKLDADKASRVHVLDADSAHSVDYTFEVSGAYQFAATELTRGAAPYGGGYQGAANAAPAETILGETPLTFYVASGLKATLGVGSDTADLVLYVSGSMIQQTTLAVHGVATPAAQKPRTPKASTAANDAAFLNAVAALIGTAASASLGTLSAVVTDEIDRFNAHIASVVFHAAGDAGANAIPTEYRNPANAEALKRSVGQLLKCLSSHIRNDSVTQPQGTGSNRFHAISFDGVVDWASLPLFESTGTVSEHVRGIADAHRSFEPHRVSAAHIAPDNTNVLAVLPALLNAHALFLTQLAALSPSVPATDNSAKTVLVHGAGFEEI